MRKFLDLGDIENSLNTKNVEVASLLIKHQLKIVTAESLTAGLLSASLANLAGASSYLLGAYVCYCDEMKESLLAVPAELLQSEGAVSAACVKVMAEHSLDQVSSAHVAIALSGFAGPNNLNWSENEPCGTVYMAIAFRKTLSADPIIKVFKQLFYPERNVVRLAACAWALDELANILHEWDSI